MVASLGSFASGQGVAQYAVPAVAGSVISSGKRITTPLSEPLEGVHIPKAELPAAPKFEVGSVNGVKAAAVDSAGPLCSVGVFVAGGSSAETPATAGAAKLLEFAAFMATANRTTFRLTRELEKYGASTSAFAGREHLGFSIRATKMQAAEVTEILLDSVLNMRLAGWEVNDLIDAIAADISAAYSKPGNLASELLHRAAFSGGLSQALLPDPARLGSIKAEALQEYVAAVIKPQNLALTGAGVSLSTLNGVAAALLPSGSGGATPSSSTYSGGVLSCLAPGVVPTVAVAYEAKGGLSDIKSAAIAAVLKQLLNETAEVLPQMKKKAEAPLTSIAPVVEMYRSTGLIGLMGTTTPGAAVSAASALTSRLEALAKSVSDTGLAAAKQSVIGSYSIANEATASVVQDMGLQLLARGKFSAGDYVAAVGGLTAGDVSKYVGEVLKGQPTLVAAGALNDLPKYDAVAKKFA